MANLKNLIGKALNRATSSKPSDDGYKTRKVKGMTPSKMGETKIQRGEKIVQKAESKLEKSVVKPFERKTEKVNKLKQKYGEYPTYGQQKKIEKAGPTNTEAINYERMKSAKDFGQSPSEVDLRPEKFSFFNDRTFNREALKKTVKAGKTLIKKGQMKSANIRNKQ